MTFLMGLHPIFKLAIAVVIDVLDFTIMRIPGLDTIFDIVTLPILFALIGPMAVFQVFEIMEITGQVDAQIPTATIIVLISTFLGLS